MTDTTPWRPAAGPPAGAGPARVPGVPDPGPARFARAANPACLSGVPEHGAAARPPGAPLPGRAARGPDLPGGMAAPGGPGAADPGFRAASAARSAAVPAGPGGPPGSGFAAGVLPGRDSPRAVPRSAAGSGGPAPADPGFVAGALPGRGGAAAESRQDGAPAVRQAVFGSARYPGRASGKRSVRLAARAASPCADQLGPAHRAGGTAGPGSRPGSGGGPPLGRFLAKAAAVTAGLTAAGAVFGLVRDQTIAHLFGAGHDSDAFLISWTVPEMASTLLIEDAMALLMVPAFSYALTRRAASRAGLTRRQARAQDPVRLLVGATLPRLAVFLAAVASVLVVAAPAVVAVLAPGLPDPALAVECTRMTALTVLSFGVAGYFSAALRAHRSFVPPAAIYVSYNVGIIGTMLALHRLWGVRAAAAGVAVGGLLMVLVQLPAFIRNVGFGARRAKRTAPRSQRDRDRPTLIAFGVIAPVIFFAVFRQSQVLVERFLAASLPPGAISHLNYAQKVAQMPMVLSLMICTVTFPVVAQAMAGGEREKARRRVEQDLALASLAVLMGTALVIGYAPQIIQVLFERGAFTRQDTLATASVMRVYGLGLLGHCLVGALSRPFFSTARPTWFPALAMGAGLLVNIVAGALAVGWWGTYGIAAANAAGITTTAALLLTGLGSRIIAIQVRQVAVSIGRLAVAAVAACVTGWIAGPMIPDPMLSAALGCLLVPAMFAATGMAIRALEVTALPGQISQLTQRFRNVR
ncbi:lipid II flippase MurJ [Streptomyces sp. NPDC023588]|uniref:murein biosynthesis integral membrane protein MurJ n=1 Tax=Streptomyces sp. NPDC023588 TaxID=3154907 RepID=UPI003401E7F0